MIAQYFTDYRDLGLPVIPIEWDTVANAPRSHRQWSGDISRLTLRPEHNGLMICTSGTDYACIDFDIKNTQRKTLFDEWLTILTNDKPEIYSRLYIERTRSGGYHAWFRYRDLTRKLSLAESDRGSEVIALYCCGPLVYTYPTPGYSEYHASMQDADYLTDTEFQYIISLSQYFNEYSPSYDPSLKAISYPPGRESAMAHFDQHLPDEAWQRLLADIGLTPIPGYRYRIQDRFKAYRRQGSASEAISAKVYFHTKRVLIFSASMHDYPNWHNRADYPVWSLPPSFILFYKNGRDWQAAAEEMTMIADAIGMELPIAPSHDFPLDVFPEDIAASIVDVSEHRSLPVPFVALSGLWTVSSLAGTMYHSAFNSEGKNILYCMLIGPVSVGKTPAFNVMCASPLKDAYETLDKRYQQELEEWNAERDSAAEAKKHFTGKRPQRYMPIVKDGTTEGYIHKSQSQRNGIGVYQDEAESIFNAGNFKGTNDSISFFTQAFSGGRMEQIRADETKERVVPNLNLNLLMGTQPNRLRNIFTEDRLESGFAARFLMVESGYKELNTEADPFGDKKEMCAAWQELVRGLFLRGHEYNSGHKPVIEIPITEDAMQTYRMYYKGLLQEANNRIQTKAESYVIGTEAKMSAYFPRLCQVLSIIHNYTGPVVTQDIVHKAYRLYRYFADSTVRIIGSLHTEAETGLPKELEELYQALPESFTSAEASAICTRLNLRESRFRESVRRKDMSQLFRKTGHGKWMKR